MQARLRTVFGRTQEWRISLDPAVEPMRELLLDTTAILKVGDHDARDFVSSGVDAKQHHPCADRVTHTATENKPIYLSQSLNTAPRPRSRTLRYLAARSTFAC